MTLWFEFFQSGYYNFVILRDSYEKGNDNNSRLLLAISPEDKTDRYNKVDSLYLYNGLSRKDGYDVNNGVYRLKVIGVDVI